MLNVNLLSQNYGEESCRRLIEIYNLLTESCEDKKLVADAEEIVKMLVGLKLDIDSVCAGFAYAFVLKDEKVKVLL